MPLRKRTILYGRVSTVADGTPESRSVDDQLEWLRRWAEREDRHVVAELRDDGISASRFGSKARPGWQSAMDLIAAGKVDELATWELSRQTRDRAVWAALLAACTEHGVMLVVGGRVHDPTDPDDGFMLDIGMARAVHESAQTSKRTKRAVESRAARGAPHGRVVDGYLIEYDPTTGAPIRRVLDPLRAPIIREIADRLLAGESAYGIAADLNGRGLTTATGKPWRGGNVVKRMTSPTIAGLRVHRGEVLEGVAAQWPPIVTPAEHARIVELLADPRRKSNKEGPGVRHLLTGIALCGVCGSPVRVIAGYRPNGTRRVRYGCAASHCVQRAAEPVDAVVEAVLLRFLSRPDVLGELTERQDEHDVGEVAALRAQLAEVRAKVESGQLTLDDLAYFRAKWEPRLAEAERRARPKHVPSVVYDVAGSEAQARWDATPITGRRAIVKALVTVRIMPVGRGNQYTRFDPSAIIVERRPNG